jgi:hypothetical protein
VLKKKEGGKKNSSVQEYLASKVRYGSVIHHRETLFSVVRGLTLAFIP